MASLRKKINTVSNKYIIERRTKKKDVMALIDKLHPFSTNIELIRMGAETDGGYLLPDDFKGIVACFSPGVETMSQFEEACYRLGMKLFLMDKSIDAPNLPDDIKFHFTKKFIGCTEDDDFTTMDEWVNNSDVATDSDLLLQMDIEGFEYFSIINMSNRLLNRFRIINIEFHDLEKIWEPNFYKVASCVFDKLLQNHTCVHIHPNNHSPLNEQLRIKIPCVAEFTFYRNDRISHKIAETHYPHPLDRDNKKEAKPLVLPENWYKS